MADIFSNAMNGVTGAWNSLTGETAAQAAERAAQLQAEATDRATAKNTYQYEAGTKALAPWLESGKRGLTEYDALMGYGGDTAGALNSLRSAPGSMFRLAQGERSLNAGLASKGGMGSGKAMNAATQFGQDYASNEYGNRLNQLAESSRSGQSSAARVADMGTEFAKKQGDLYTNQANAAGAAGMTGANARQSGIGNVVKLAAAAYGFSDIRLKTNIKRIGTHPLGIGIYQWKYKEKPADFPVEYENLANWGEPSQGVMANEVREVMPEAVSKAGDYDVVNYGMLGGLYAN